MPMSKSKILLLATFHMGDTTDLFTQETRNPVSERQRKEIGEIVDRIMSFNPEKVALEWASDRSAELNEQYTRYLRGELDLPQNEVYQLGFRLAARMDHKRIYGIDWMEQGAATKSVEEIYEWARAHQPKLFETLFGWLHGEQKNQDHYAPPTLSLLERYRACNERNYLRQHHVMNLNIARIGAKNSYIGMEWLTWWYRRNLIIFSNLSRLVELQEERILLVIGAAHMQILAHFLEESGLFEVEWGSDYLG